MNHGVRAGGNRSAGVDAQTGAGNNAFLFRLTRGVAGGGIAENAERSSRTVCGDDSVAVLDAGREWRERIARFDVFREDAV